MTTEPCKHVEEYGEGVEFPLAASLEHFDECFPPERRLEAYGWMRERSEVGTRCLMAGHAEEKALAESAIEIGRRLGKAEGRKQAGEEIAVKIAEHRSEFEPGSPIDTELFVAQEVALGVALKPQKPTEEPA